MNAAISSLEDVIGNPNWFPDHMDFKRNVVGFVRTDRNALCREAFLDSRWNRSVLPRIEIPIPTVLSASEKLPRPKLNILWHTAFCCSTLLARCLDAEGANLSLKEPQILIMLAEAKRAGRDVAAAVDATVKLLARGNEHVLVKPTNAVNNLIPEVLRATDGRMLFLYSDCKSFLVSIAKKGEMGRIFARKLFGLFAADGHPQTKWPWQTLFELSDMQIAALVWHMQIAELLRSRDAARSTALNCDDFLGRPRETLEKLNAFFALDLSASQLDAALPLLARNAKDTNEAFSADRRAAEAEDTARMFGTELDTVVEWSYRACPETPRGNPLGSTL